MKHGNEQPSTLSRVIRNLARRWDGMAHVLYRHTCISLQNPSWRCHGPVIDAAATSKPAQMNLPDVDFPSRDRSQSDYHTRHGSGKHPRLTLKHRLATPSPNPESKHSSLKHTRVDVSRDLDGRGLLCKILDQPKILQIRNLCAVLRH